MIATRISRSPSRMAMTMLGLGLTVLHFAAVPFNTAHAQEAYPSKPIRLVVPYPPGGMGDIVTRMLVPKWSELLKQQIIVDNRGGGGSNIGIDMVAKAAPDGYTMGLFDTAIAVNASLYAKLPYDAQRDLAPLMVVARGPLVLVVNASVPANNVAELVALARAKPGSLSYASAGSGSPVHLAGEMFKTAIGADILHIPYKGAGPAVVDVIGGQVPMMFALPGTARAHIASGKMRPLAITGAQRFKGLPNVPTFAEEGIKGMDATLIVGFMLPAKTPPAIIATLHDALASVLKSAEITDRLGELALNVVGASPERSSTLLREETELWAKVVKSSGAKAE